MQSASVSASSQPAGLVVKSNILAVSGAAPTGSATQSRPPDLVRTSSTATSGMTFQGNDYTARGALPLWRHGAQTETSLPAWRSATGQEFWAGRPVGSTADPRLPRPGQAPAAGMIGGLTGLASYYTPGATVRALGRAGPVDLVGNRVPVTGALVGAIAMRR